MSADDASYHLDAAQAGLGAVANHHLTEAAKRSRKHRHAIQAAQALVLAARRACAKVLGKIKEGH